MHSKKLPLYQKLVTSLILLVGCTCAHSAFYITGMAGGGEATAHWSIDTSINYPSGYAFFHPCTPDPVTGECPNDQPQVSRTTLPYSNRSNGTVEFGTGQLGVGYGKRFHQAFFLGVEASMTAMPQPEVNTFGSVEEVSYTTCTGACIPGAPTPFPPAGTPITAGLSSDTTASVLDPDINFDLKVGIHMTPFTMGYAKGGVTLNRLQLETTSIYTFDNPGFIREPTFPNSFTSTFADTVEEDVTGLHLVAGIEHLITRYLAFNAEYTYVYYGHLSASGIEATQAVLFGSTDVLTIPDGLKTSNSMTFSKQTVMAGLTFYFGAQY